MTPISHATVAAPSGPTEWAIAAVTSGPDSPVGQCPARFNRMLTARAPQCATCALQSTSPPEARSTARATITPATTAINAGSMNHAPHHHADPGAAPSNPTTPACTPTVDQAANAPNTGRPTFGVAART